jgi:AcrR family transcriptional regulator
MEKVASRAKVAKTTLYRWWPTKIALLMHIFEHEATKRLLGVPPSGSVDVDLRHVLRGLLRLFRTTSAGAAVIGMIVEAQLNPDLASTFRDEFVARGRVLTSRALRQALSNGELPSGTDIDLTVDVLSGAIWYRLLLGNAPLDNAYADGIVDILLYGIRKDRAAIAAKVGDTDSSA